MMEVSESLDERTTTILNPPEDHFSLIKRSLQMWNNLRTFINPAAFLEKQEKVWPVFGSPWPSPPAWSSSGSRSWHPSLWSGTPAGGWPPAAGSPAPWSSSAGRSGSTEHVLCPAGGPWRPGVAQIWMWTDSARQRLERGDMTGLGELQRGKVTTCQPLQTTCWLRCLQGKCLPRKLTCLFSWSHRAGPPLLAAQTHSWSSACVPGQRFQDPETEHLGSAETGMVLTHPRDSMWERGERTPDTVLTSPPGPFVLPDPGLLNCFQTGSSMRGLRDVRVLDLSCGAVYCISHVKSVPHKVNSGLTHVLPSSSWFGRRSFNRGLSQRFSETEHGFNIKLYASFICLFFILFYFLGVNTLQGKGSVLYGLMEILACI